MYVHVRRFVVAMVVALTFTAAPALAQVVTSGSTGADGAFTATCTPLLCTVTVALPPSGVFNFTTVTVPASVTLRFARNAANTPATILATGDVLVTGTVDVSGSQGGSFGGAVNPVDDNGGLAGPGGFDGGSGAKALLGASGGAGLGPGGGGGGGQNRNGSSGGFATVGNPGNGGTPGGAVYGTSALLPLIGGSGGGGGGLNNLTSGGRAPGGGGGGGAILIASSGTITVSGVMRARGSMPGATDTLGNTSSGGGGSGGAIRLVATTVTGSGTFDVTNAGGGGGLGRIRIEAFNSSLQQSPVVVQLPNPVTLATTPALSIASVAGTAAPSPPSGSFAQPDITLPTGTTSPVTIGVTATNIPPGTTVTVTVVGIDTSATSTTAILAGTFASSSASVTLAIPTTQPSLIFASASFPLTALAPDGALVMTAGR